MSSNRDLFKLVDLIGGRRPLSPPEQYTPIPPDPPRIRTVPPSPRSYADVEKFWKDIERLGHEQSREIEQVQACQQKQIEQTENYQKQNVEMGSVLNALASAVSLLVKEIKDLKIPPVEVTVHDRIDPIKVEIPTVKVDQKPVKVEVELKQPKTAKRKGTIKHSDGTTSTVEVS